MYIYAYTEPIGVPTVGNSLRAREGNAGIKGKIEKKKIIGCRQKISFLKVKSLPLNPQNISTHFSRQNSKKNQTPSPTPQATLFSLTLQFPSLLVLTHLLVNFVLMLSHYHRHQQPHPHTTNPPGIEGLKALSIHAHAISSLAASPRSSKPTTRRSSFKVFVEQQDQVSDVSTPYSSNVDTKFLQ